MRKIFLMICMFGIAVTSNAQFGIRAGFNSSNFSKTDFATTGGNHFGAYYTAITSAGLLSIEPGIQFSGKGFETTDAKGQNITESLGYLDFPALVRLNILPYLNVFAGPQASILVSRKYSIDNRTTSTSLEPVRGYDLGAVAGVGVNIVYGINFQVSYDLGLTSLNYFNTDVSNRVLKFSLGYSFGK